LWDTCISLSVYNSLEVLCFSLKFFFYCSIFLFSLAREVGERCAEPESMMMMNLLRV